jgi:hypothetical protein
MAGSFFWPAANHRRSGPDQPPARARRVLALTGSKWQAAQASAREPGTRGEIRDPAGCLEPLKMALMMASRSMAIDSAWRSSLLRAKAGSLMGKPR